jgi:RNA polymerase sigma-70 factor (ECF subfamily)
MSATRSSRPRRLKRGGAITHLSLDWQSADTQFQIADSGQIPPDAAYDREWAVALLERVISKLREESVADGKEGRFEQLKSYLTVGKGEISYATAAVAVALALALEEGAVRVAVHRLRKRYRELLRNEVADTLADPAMVDEELAVLLGAFG